MGKKKKGYKPLYNNGAEGGIRTPTSLSSHDPELCPAVFLLVFAFFDFYNPWNIRDLFF
jgi:hypothetical protein